MGIVENDIILEIDGTKIDDQHTLATLVRNKNIGDKISLKILHKGETKMLEATLSSIGNEQNP